LLLNTASLVGGSFGCANCLYSIDTGALVGGSFGCPNCLYSIDTGALIGGSVGLYPVDTAAVIGGSVGGPVGGPVGLYPVDTVSVLGRSVDGPNPLAPSDLRTNFISEYIATDLIRSVVRPRACNRISRPPTRSNVSYLTLLLISSYRILCCLALLLTPTCIVARLPLHISATLSIQCSLIACSLAHAFYSAP
jgi:hypothetical protein